MRCRARTAYTLTIASFLLILIGWIIPFWFGRFYEETRSKKQWGLFYVIQCRIGRCENLEGILQASNVDFGGAESPIVLESISILATLSLSLCFLGLLIVLVFHCHVCGKKYSYHNYVTGAAIVQFTAAIFVFVTIILSAIATGVFFSELPMDDIIEFPWSLLCFCLGECMLIVSAVIYILITFRWKRYRHIYAKKRYLVASVTNRFGDAERNYEPVPDYNIDDKYRFKPYNRSSFIGYYRGKRDDSGSVGSKSARSGYYFPNRSPWDKSRYYYSYPQRGIHANSTAARYKFAKSHSTRNSADKGRGRNASDSDTRIWHTNDSFTRSEEHRSRQIEDVHM